MTVPTSMILAGRIGYYRLSAGSPSTLSARELYDVFVDLFRIWALTMIIK